MITFSTLWWLLLVPVAILIATLGRRRTGAGLVRLPNTGDARRRPYDAGGTARRLLYDADGALAWLGVVALAALALCGPELLRLMSNGQLTQGRRIFIAMDDSYSMGREFDGEAPVRPPSNWTVTKPGSQEVPGVEVVQKPRRIDVGQAAAGKFVDMRIARKAPDRIGWIDFDGEARLRLPLESNLQQAELISRFPPSGGGYGGLGEGTNFAKAIEFSVERFLETEEKTGIRSTNVLVMITDGEDKLDGPTHERLLKALASARVRYYLIGVGPELAKTDVSIIKLCQDSGGRVFRAESGNLDAFFETIDGLESGPIEAEVVSTHHPLFFVPLAAAALLWLVVLFYQAALKGE